MSTNDLGAKVTVSGGDPNINMLSDGDLTSTTKLPVDQNGGASWIQYEFPHPQTIRAVTLLQISNEDWQAERNSRELETSDDGKTFHTVGPIPGDGTLEHTVCFAPVTARFFRISFKKLPPPPLPFWIGDVYLSSHKPPKPATDYLIAELVLHPGARVNRFEEKAAFDTMDDLYQFATPEVASSDAIQKADVLDLTSKMQPDGTLQWTPPAGDWMVLRSRLFYCWESRTHPATAEATGLEVDKS